MKNSDIIKIENLSHDKNTYIIRWNITKLCNYSCDFCIQGNHEKHILDSKGESKQKRKLICEKIIKLIENEINGKYKNLKIYLIGGEITILNDFMEILNKLSNVKFNGNLKIYITTNMSLSIEKLTEMKNNFMKVDCKNGSRKLDIMASFYKQYTNKKEFIEKLNCINTENKIKTDLINNLSKFKKLSLIKKIIKKYNSKPKIIVNANFPLLTDQDYIDYLKFRKKYRYKLNSINYIIIRNYKTDISDKVKEKLKEKDRKIIKITLKDNSIKYFTDIRKVGLNIEDTNHFDPYGMWCNSGINSITIDQHGVVSRCASCKDLTKIGNIIEDNLNICNDYFKCPSHNCNCNYYSEIKKRK